MTSGIYFLKKALKTQEKKKNKQKHHQKKIGGKEYTDNAEHN